MRGLFVFFRLKYNSHFGDERALWLSLDLIQEAVYNTYGCFHD